MKDQSASPSGLFSFTLSVSAVLLAGYLFVTLAATPPQAIIIDTSSPTPPRGIQAGAIGSDRVEVHWIASVDNVGVTGYRIYRCPGDCQDRPWPGGFAPVGVANSATIFVDATVRPDTEYTYLVTAFDAAGNESEPGQPPTTGGYRALRHDHQPHTLPIGHTAQVDVIYPPSVAPGATFRIRRTLILRPDMMVGHTDLHYRTDNDDAYRQWAFPGHAIKQDSTAIVTAPPTPTNIFFYAETHLSWPGIVGTDQSPLCSAWFRIVVTNGFPLDIRPTSLQPGTVTIAYAQQLTAVGEISGPFRWGITHSGSLPPGLSIDSRTGTIGGTPSRAGNYSFTALVEADSGPIATRRFVVTIQEREKGIYP